MWIVSWVVIDEIFNYYPCVRFAKNYEDAREIQSILEEEQAEQQDREDYSELFFGKIVSEIYINEIDFYE